MKLVLGAAIAALACGAAISGAAWAQTASSDKGNTFSFAKPAKWDALLDKAAPGAAVKLYVSGTANEECWFMVVPRPETASATPSSVAKSWAKDIPAAEWVATTKGAPLLQDGGEFVSASVDTSKTFPVQLGVLKGKDGPVVAAIHPRPGQEIRAVCGSYDGKDRTEAFKTIASSVTTPKDAEYATQIAAAKAEQDAATAAAAAAPAPEDKKKKK